MVKCAIWVIVPQVTVYEIAIAQGKAERAYGNEGNGNWKRKRKWKWKREMVVIAE